jgi:hypothetical protein
MAIPDTRDGLESLGYKYTGSSACRGCGAEMQWFETPRGKKMPMSAVSGTEDDESQKLEAHWTVCPNAKDFRKKK